LVSDHVLFTAISSVLRVMPALSIQALGDEVDNNCTKQAPASQQINQGVLSCCNHD
jgi:hypothetical protein